MSVARILLAALLSVATCLWAAPTARAATAAPVAGASLPAAVSDNPIVAENQQPGSSEWIHGSLVADDATGQIKAYWSAASAKPTETITLYVTVNPAQTYSLDVFRLGWYQGTGARRRLHVDSLNGVQQAPCVPDPTTGVIACGWTPSYSLAIPADWTSGVYLSLLTNAQGYQNYAIFVVRDDRPAPFLYQQNIMTDQAYNNYPNDGRTGKSLYTYNSFGANTISGETRAVKVSFDRPYPDYGFMQVDQMEFIRWIEHSGYDVTYATDLDTHENGAGLLTHRAVLDVGHDEYWSPQMRDAMEAARDAGVNLAFFAADTASVQVRLEASATGTADRVMVCYKSATVDPIYGPTTTVAFRNAPVNRPEQSLRGVISGSMLNPGTPNFDYVVTNSTHWIYAGTGFKDGDTVPGIVGYEMDRYRSQYPPPSSANWTLLSHSPFTDYQGVADYANSSLYQAPSGAWVFSSGTISWSRGLDGFWYGRADPRIQQTTRNLFDAFLFGAPVVHDLKVSAPGSVTAGTSFAVSVVAENAQGNPVTSYSGTVHFATSDTSGGVRLPANATLTNGQGTFSVTLGAGGGQTLTVSDAANSLSTTVSVVVAGTVTFRAATQSDQSGTATSLTLRVPAGVANGDALYAVVIYEDGSVYAPTDPQGWTLLGEAVNPNNGRTRLLRRIASSEPASYRWTFASANHVGGAMAAYAGVDATTPEDAPALGQAGTSLTPTSPSRTTATNGAWLLSIYGTAGWGGSTSTGPSGMNVRATFGSNHSFGLADQPIASPGATGSRVWTTSYATPWAALSLALRPSGATAAVQRLTVAAPANVTAGAPFTLTVRAVDAQGNTVTSYGGTIHFTASDSSSGVVLPPDAALSGGQGTFSATLQVVGSQTVTATDTTAPAINGTATLSVDSGLATFDVSVPQTATAGRPFNVTVTARDANGAVLASYNGTVHFTVTDTSPAVVVPPDSRLTNGSGTFAVTLITAASQTITVSDPASQASTAVSVAVTAAPASRLVLGTTATPIAGAAFSFTAVAQDQYGNTDLAYAGTVHFTTTDSSTSIALPPDAPLANGRGTFSATLIKAGSQSITGTDRSAPTIAGALAVTVRAASATHLALATTATPTAGTAFPFTVVAQDPYGNTDLAYAGTMHFTSSNTATGVALPADARLSGGQGSFSATLTRAAAQTITATDTATPTLGGSLTVTVLAGNATVLTLEAPASARAGQAFTVKVTLADQFGNVATGYRGTVHFTSSDTLPTVVLPADYTFTAGDAGVHSFVQSATLWTPPTQTVTVTDTTTSNLHDTRSIAVGLM
jgi:hypothetical protein